MINVNPNPGQSAGENYPYGTVLGAERGHTEKCKEKQSEGAETEETEECLSLLLGFCFSRALCCIHIFFKF